MGACNRSAKEVADSRIAGPPVDQFPEYPASWYLFCLSRQVRRKPFAKDFLGGRLVAYRTSGGQLVVLDARCSHMGSNLGEGSVIGDRIQCPFHHWQYGPDGRCQHIPAQRSIPDFARQGYYPAVERHGFVFVFNGCQPLFALPFFRGCQPEELTPAKPFGTVLNCPWYLVGANAFDLQHFRAAHDRRLKGAVSVQRPDWFARRASATFAIAGRTLRDSLIRRFAGDEVTLAICDWCGTLSFTTATFRRTTGFGMVAVLPLTPNRCSVQVVAFVRRSRTITGSALLDPVNRAIRRYFIMKFLTADAVRLNGVRYNPAAFVESDRDMVEYFHWLASLPNIGITEESASHAAAICHESTSDGQNQADPALSKGKIS